MHKKLAPKQREESVSTLKTRFDKNMDRHHGLEWAKVHTKLEASAEKLWSLNEMEITGGEPDVVGFDENTNTFFMIVQEKALKAAEVFATTVKHWSRGKNSNRRITLLAWQLI